MQAYDLLFRPVFLFFIMNQGSRRVVHVAATRNPTQDWTAQQLRNATMDQAAPRFLIRDRDEKFGGAFDRVAKGVGTSVIKTAVRAPNMNPVGERFVGSLRREALDHVFLLGADHLASLGRHYADYFNRARPHQGIGQRIPDAPANDNRTGNIVAIPCWAAFITTTAGQRKPCICGWMGEVARTGLLTRSVRAGRVGKDKGAVRRMLMHLPALREGRAELS